MNRILPIFLFFILGHSYAAENLTDKDFEGSWKSNYTAVKGETQRLKISLNSKSTFERHFEFPLSYVKQSPSDGESQFLETSTFELIDDVLILMFTSQNINNEYKLVLSGWKSDGNKLIYGSMFMYSNGAQFNMLPVSFKLRE